MFYIFVSGLSVQQWTFVLRKQSFLEQCSNALRSQLNPNLPLSRRGALSKLSYTSFTLLFLKSRYVIIIGRLLLSSAKYEYNVWPFSRLDPITTSLFIEMLNVDLFCVTLLFQPMFWNNIFIYYTSFIPITFLPFPLTLFYLEDIVYILK